MSKSRTETSRIMLAGRFMPNLRQTEFSELEVKLNYLTEVTIEEKNSPIQNYSLGNHNLGNYNSWQYDVLRLFPD